MKMPVLFAPVLRSEGWSSIHLQTLDILTALRAHPNAPAITVVAPKETLARIPGGKIWLRDVSYPRLLRSAASRIGSCVLHVSDHSYGHLCHAHRPVVVNCNDLHHIVRPELPAGQLARWTTRVRGLLVADRVLAISNHLADEIRSHLGIPAERVVALPGAVDHRVFRESPEPEASGMLPLLSALRKDHLLILHVGTNHPRKDLPTLLRAMQLLREDRRLPVKLVKIGPRLGTDPASRQLAASGVPTPVVDLGALNPAAVAAACRLAHVLAFPSYYEGFGRPVLEAQACGLPCVLAAAASLPEVGGEGSLYHPPGDHEALADQLEKVLTDRELRNRLIVAGRANASRYTWEKYADKLTAIYREVSS